MEAPLEVEKMAPVRFPTALVLLLCWASLRIAKYQNLDQNRCSPTLHKQTKISLSCVSSRFFLQYAYTCRKYHVCIRSTPRSHSVCLGSLMNCRFCIPGCQRFSLGHETGSRDYVTKDTILYSYSYTVRISERSYKQSRMTTATSSSHPQRKPPARYSASPVLQASSNDRHQTRQR